MFREAWIGSWFHSLVHSQAGRRDGFSFEYICDVLGLEPDYLRRGLREWGDAHLARYGTGPVSLRSVDNARVSPGVF